MATPSPVERYALRDGGSGDLDGVMLVMERAFDAEFGEAWTRSQLLGILPMSGVDLTIAVNERNGSIAGFSLVRHVADEAELLLIAVQPDDRRQGVGTQLLERFADISREAGLTRVHLEVREGNPAVALYRGHGFLPIGRRRDYYQGIGGTRHDAITLSLDLHQ
jgi:ribosomal-protein-alanine N-acetyltransferase